MSVTTSGREQEQCLHAGRDRTGGRDGRPTTAPVSAGESSSALPIVKMAVSEPAGRNAPDPAMFEIKNDNPGELKRIIAAGAIGILIGLFLLTTNIVGPLVSGTGYGLGNVIFGLLGIVVTVLATHPTYQATLKLESV